MVCEKWYNNKESLYKYMRSTKKLVLLLVYTV